jgi:hypothetical protein
MFPGCPAEIPPGEAEPDDDVCTAVGLDAAAFASFLGRPRPRFSGVACAFVSATIWSKDTGMGGLSLDVGGGLASGVFSDDAAPRFFSSHFSGSPFCESVDAVFAVGCTLFESVEFFTLVTNFFFKLSHPFHQIRYVDFLNLFCRRH